MRVAMCQDHLLRAVSGSCALFWLVGSLSLGQGSFSEQWTKPHCPSNQAQSGQQSHHCVWHCDGIDEQVVGGQGGTSSNLDSGTVRGEFVSIPHAALAYAQIVPRGPPGFITELP